MQDTPSIMRALQLLDYEAKPESLTLRDNVPVPRPGPGEVLVKIAASPINPSDLAFINGKYGFKKPTPAIPGFEGSGTVVASGSGTMARFLSGKRVACSVAQQKLSSGMWSEYAVVPAQFCIPLSKDVDLDQGAMMLINPLTAWAMVDEARRAEHRAIVQTAAASALGKMLVRLARRFRMPIINIVRRAEQVEVLRQAGAEHVLDSSTLEFDSKLKELCNQLSATCGFDAVGGELTGRVLRAQPKGSRIFVYGGLALKPSEVDVGSLIFEGKVVAGFYVTDWLNRKSLVEKIRLARQVQKLLASDLKSDVQAKVPLAEANKALQQYMSNMTAGKVLLVP